MPYEVEYTDEFNAWWEALTEAEQRDIWDTVEQLKVHAPRLGRPFVGSIGAKCHNMKELKAMNFRVLLLALDALEKEIESLIALEQTLRGKPQPKWGMRDYELSVWLIRRQAALQTALGKTPAELLADVRATRVQWTQDAQAAQSEGRFLRITFES